MKLHVDKETITMECDRIKPTVSASGKSLHQTPAGRQTVQGDDGVLYHVNVSVTTPNPAFKG